MFIPGGLLNPPLPTNPAQDWPLSQGLQRLNSMVHPALSNTEHWPCLNVIAYPHAAAQVHPFLFPTMSINNTRRLRP